MKVQFKNVIIIPSYRELLALPKLLKDLSNSLESHDMVLVIDDSPREISDHIKQICRASLVSSSCHLIFIQNGAKMGRGAAVRRGMQIALDSDPNLEYFLECDADGSHTKSDIVTILRDNVDYDLLVGSRYVYGSKIEGWPPSRRAFSWALNKIIPKATQTPLKDITNGLRRYSRNAVLEILNVPQQSKGFIYLTEQAMIVNKASLSIHEVPINFVNRRLGESTVTWKEIVGSIIGFSKIILNHHLKGK